MSREIIDIDNLILVHTTAAAYLVRNVDGEECWIPKSQVDYIEFGADLIDDATHRPMKEISRISMPEWLAEKNNLI